MRRLFVALMGGALLCTGLSMNRSSIEAANEEALDNETIMRKLNRKKNNEGVHYQVKLKLDSDPVAWADLAKASKEYAELTVALGKNKPSNGSQASWDKLCKSYAADAKALFEATGKKDKAAATAAFDRLTKSCQACHDEHR